MSAAADNANAEVPISDEGGAPGAQSVTAAAPAAEYTAAMAGEYTAAPAAEYTAAMAGEYTAAPAGEYSTAFPAAYTAAPAGEYTEYTAAPIAENTTAPTAASAVPALDGADSASSASSAAAGAFLDSPEVSAAASWSPHHEMFNAHGEEGYQQAVGQLEERLPAEDQPAPAGEAAPAATAFVAGSSVGSKLHLLRRSLPWGLTCCRIVAAGLLYLQPYWGVPAARGGKQKLHLMQTAAVPSLLFSAAAATDWLDGWLARRWGVCTAVGAAVDAVADKLLVVAALGDVTTAAAAAAASPAAADGACGVGTGLPLLRLLQPAVSLLLLREVAVQALRQQLQLQHRGHLTGVSFLGKAKTAAEMFSVSLLLLLLPQQQEQQHVPRAGAAGGVAAAAAKGIRAAATRCCSGAVSLLLQRPASAAAAAASRLRCLIGFGSKPSGRHPLLMRCGKLLRQAAASAAAAATAALWGLEDCAVAAKRVRLLSPAAASSRAADALSAAAASRHRSMPQRLVLRCAAVAAAATAAAARGLAAAATAAAAGCRSLCKLPRVQAFAAAAARNPLARPFVSAAAAAATAASSSRQALQCTYIDGYPSLLTVAASSLWVSAALAVASAAEYVARALLLP
ncbi:ice-structuring glycoprotein-like [Cyclospora cayetanensis]|uniref:Ice-structuring glycoprotein-like n=1 Tax=Cyclospora cayetanensis TaxID=88456 RepID=A0A6P6RX03_9EIME|nr:ice-structuring glycoprotein-like [Cyclospora cayetanensis]